MSKKDFQAIARAVYASRGHYEINNVAVEVRAETIRDVTNNLADALAEDNPRFDRARFLEACETGRCKGMGR